MINEFIIFTEGGIVLWKKTFTPVSVSLYNYLIESVFINQNNQSCIQKDSSSINWTTDSNSHLVFTVVHHSLLQLENIDELLKNVKSLFISLYQDQLAHLDTSIPDFNFDPYFDTYYSTISKEDNLKNTQNLENNQNIESIQSIETTQNIQSDTENPSSFQKRRPKRGKKSSKKQNANDTTQLKGKPMRKWNPDGSVQEYQEDDPSNLSLDYSDKSVSTTIPSQISSPIATNLGSHTASNEFIVHDISDKVQQILSSNESDVNDSEGTLSNKNSNTFSFFSKFFGSSTKIDSQSLDKALAVLSDKLLKKNIANEVVVSLCNSIRSSLLGTTTNSINNSVSNAIQESLRKILTPSTSTDLLHEIKQYRASSSANSRPYVISVVGVNGVGKSTNLSKIAFWLLQNNLNILVAACDTFRSGAVEQLRVHVNNLRQLCERENTESGTIELYERGYGNDAANIARDAVQYAAKQNIDVVLIDTAGRRHNDTRLMSSLEKFAKVANPDKIIMVGEALVGTDSVQQAKNFNAAFGPTRNIDFLLVSKCDTVGNMIGTLVNMTYTTKIPVLFVGTGQMYTDLRTLSVPWAVNLLMSN